MQCPRGSKITESTHTIKTINKAVEWYPDCQESHLPITVEQQTAANGRVRIVIRDRNRKLIHTRG